MLTAMAQALVLALTSGQSLTMTDTSRWNPARSGRPLVSDRVAEARGAVGPQLRRRRAVLHETLARFAQPGERDRLAAVAEANLGRWRDERTLENGTFAVSGDWGEVAGMATRASGERFAVLNMANAYTPGGAYVEGTVAQEENMFRRTDCHFHVRGSQLNPLDHDLYSAEMTRLLEGADGRVYLDVEVPRLCVRGPEDREIESLGYQWLADEEVFDFYELRSAGNDLRDGRAYSAADMRRRIAAQLDTLESANVRHVVLGAFGCGAFGNPASEVARLYREELHAREGAFDVVVFAVFDAGYGPNNFVAFESVFGTRVLN